MKQNIPPAARDVLARQAAADEHPSADLLSGFVEQALAPAEKKRVVSHLAACSDCRQIVFLAGAGGEEQVAPVAAATKPGHDGHPMRRWAPWKWALPALAVLAVVAGIVMHAPFQPARKTTIAANRPPEVHADTTIPENEKPSSPQSATAYSNQAKPASAEPALAVSKDEMRKTALTGRPKAGGSANEEVVLHAPPSANITAQSTASAEVAAQPALAAKAAAPAPPAPVTSQTGGVGPAGSATNAKGVSNTPALAARAAVADQSALGSSDRHSVDGVKSLAVKARWRITDEGELERSIIPGNWTRVLAEQPVSFRAVAVIGNEIWAGGSNGALFHSTDAGQAWSKVMLIADGQREPGAVVSIRFDTILQGKVTTDSATTWSTSDGGRTWRRQ